MYAAVETAVWVILLAVFCVVLVAMERSAADRIYTVVAVVTLFNFTLLPRLLSALLLERDRDAETMAARAKFVKTVTVWTQYSILAASIAIVIIVHFYTPTRPYARYRSGRRRTLRQIGGAGADGGGNGEGSSGGEGGNSRNSTTDLSPTAYRPDLRQNMNVAKVAAIIVGVLVIAGLVVSRE